MHSLCISSLGAGPAPGASLRNRQRAAAAAVASHSSLSSRGSKHFSRRTDGKAMPPLPSSSSSSSLLLSRRRRHPQNLLLLLHTASSPTTTVCRVRLVESFDAHLHLDDEQRASLFALLSSDEFRARVSLEATRATKEVEFARMVFQPVPWSDSTKKGMPAEYEAYAEDKDNYVVINVPAPITFKAGVLGKRCCAIYRIVGEAK